MTIPAAFAQNSAWYVDTIAGMDRPIRDGGPATNAILNQPGGIVVDASGALIFADSYNHRVRRITPDGVINTIVGTGVAGSSGDLGPAVAARVVTPQGLAIDGAGNLYVADFDAEVIRKVTPAGVISAYAGTGNEGNGGDGGKALLADLDGPFALAIDQKGNLFIADYYNDEVREVTTDGNMVRFAVVHRPQGLAFDSAGNLYVSSGSDNQVDKITPAGSVSIIAGSLQGGFLGDGAKATGAQLSSPQGIAVDAAGDVWFADTGNGRIRAIGIDGTIQTVIGSGKTGLAPVGTDPLALALNVPSGLVFDSSGVLYWTESLNHRIRSWNTKTRQLRDVAGATLPLTTTGAPTSLALFNPASAVTDSAGNLYIADTANHVIRKILPNGTSSIVAGTGVGGFNLDVGVATQVMLASPQSVSVDAAGNLLIADSGNYRIRKVDPTGNIKTVMGSGDFLPLTGTLASQSALVYPTGVAWGPGGTYYVVDQYFEVLLFVDATSKVNLVTASDLGYFSFPSSVAVGPNANAYVADTFNNRIVQYTPSGALTGVAGTGAPGFKGDGGPANSARLTLPIGVAVDSKNQLIIADSGNARIRQVDTTGTITTIAGNGQPGFSGDKGLALNAQIGVPSSVNVDPSGNIEFSDTLNNRIRILRYQQVVSDLAISTDAPQKSVGPGDTATIRVTLTSTSGLTGVNLAVTGAPAGVVFSFLPSSTVTVAAGQNVLVSATAQIPASAVPGTSKLTITAAAGSLQKTVDISLVITNLPQITSAGVVSAASFAGGGVSPGEIIAIFGQKLGPASLVAAAFDSDNLLPTSLGGTRVLFDGSPAPLIYTVAGQIAAIVPYAVAGKATTQMQVEFNGQQSTAVALNVVEAAPALFNAGTTQAAALNEDTTINSAANPSKAGHEIVLYGTGEGATTPASVDGKLATTIFPVPVLKVSVTIGGEPAVVDYAGAAPFLAAGVIQINARIPADLPSGPAAVVVTVGTHASTGTSTIAIQ